MVATSTCAGRSLAHQRVSAQDSGRRVDEHCIGVHGYDLPHPVLHRRIGMPTDGGALAPRPCGSRVAGRSEEHTSELQSLMRISYAVFCLKTKKQNTLEHKKV